MKNNHGKPITGGWRDKSNIRRSGIYLNTYCDYNTRVNGKKERSTRILQSDHCGNSSIVKSIRLERLRDLYKVRKICPLLSDALKKVNAQ